jgi:hypothetical protein
MLGISLFPISFLHRLNRAAGARLSRLRCVFVFLKKIGTLSSSVLPTGFQSESYCIAHSKNGTK